LFGLVFQLAVSFGHIHLADGKGHLSPIDTSTVVTSVNGCSPDVPPADRAPHDHEDEYCAIYAVNSLIGSAFSTEPPALSLPLDLVGVRFHDAHEIRLTQSRHILQRVRAPPIA
jgi:hypothetical protein